MVDPRPAVTHPGIIAMGTALLMYALYRVLFCLLVLLQNVACGPPAHGMMLKPNQTVVGNAKNGFAVYSCGSPLYQQMTMPVNPPQCYPLTSQCASAVLTICRSDSYCISRSFLYVRGITRKRVGRN